MSLKDLFSRATRSIDTSDYEYYDEWRRRSPEDEHMSLEEYNEMRTQEDYGEKNYFADDDDSNDRY